ncbi:unnamed protein product [Pleuronectes platessa]|uniref:Uncharacterized protein n=1 Tax=Pleuronectes platessa TaxID=8262 RepID=A0A9N7W595_PLEPL|nr:unnamed protein product [Pleuronectes platessa]
MEDASPPPSRSRYEHIALWRRSLHRPCPISSHGGGRTCELLQPATRGRKSGLHSQRAVTSSIFTTSSYNIINNKLLEDSYGNSVRSAFYFVVTGVKFTFCPYESSPDKEPALVSHAHQSVAPPTCHRVLFPFKDQYHPLTGSTGARLPGGLDPMGV